MSDYLALKHQQYMLASRKPAKELMPIPAGVNPGSSFTGKLPAPQRVKNYTNHEAREAKAMGEPLFCHCLPNTNFYTFLSVHPKY